MSIVLRRLFYLFQMGKAAEELFHSGSGKDNYYLAIIRYRPTAYHHPGTKLGMADMVTSL